MNADQLLECIRRALETVGEAYFITEPSHDEMLQTHGLRPEEAAYRTLRSFLTRRDERVFCYEFYHQVRREMWAFQKDHPEVREERVVFQAELRKPQIGELVKYFKENPTPLDGVYVPDFILHRQRDFGRQELVVEVKAEPNLSLGAIQADLTKIDQFIGSYLYEKGLFLAVNCPCSVVQNRLDTLAENGWLDGLRHREQILMMTKHKRGEPTFECSLSAPILCCLDSKE